MCTVQPCLPPPKVGSGNEIDLFEVEFGVTGGPDSGCPRVGAGTEQPTHQVAVGGHLSGRRWGRRRRRRRRGCWWVKCEISGLWYHQ